MNEKIRGIFMGGIIISCVFVSSLASDLFQIYKGNKNMWWTPKSMMLSLNETRNNFGIFISGKSLDGYIADGKLLAKDNQGKTYKVVSRDVGVRINNWPSRKVSMLEKALWSAFGAGFGIAFLIIGLCLKLKVKADSR